jgi:hypothetical protein
MAPYLSLASYDPQAASVVPLSDHILAADIGVMLTPNMPNNSSSMS